MNCCDDYGNCRQGRDCPIRKEKYWSNKEIYAIIGMALILFWCLFGILVWALAK